MSAKSHSARLKKMAKQTAREVTRALYLIGQQVELEAERSITAGSVSGKGHVPSLPGEPPNRDTGVLDSNIETTVVAQNPPTVHVTSHAPYSSALEFGTSKMAERPFMRPAVAKFRGKIPAEISVAIRKINR
jgi:HK97 gp10 family phage protein